MSEIEYPYSTYYESLHASPPDQRDTTGVQTTCKCKGDHLKCKFGMKATFDFVCRFYRFEKFCDVLPNINDQRK